MSIPPAIIYCRMSPLRLNVTFNAELQSNIYHLKIALNKTRSGLQVLRHEDADDLMQVTIDGHIFPNIIVKNIIKFMRAEYAFELCMFISYTNMLSNTFTQTQFDATQEKMVDLLELKFEAYGMKYQKQWSEESINEFNVYKSMYSSYKQHYNIN